MLPVSVRIRLARLRYGGHIERRQEYLLKSGKTCRQMDLLLPDVNLHVPPGLKTGKAKPGKVTGATAHRSALQAAGLPENEWSALAKQSSKADWRRLLKGKVTQNLMRPWIERQLKTKTARESAAEKVGRAILPADIHDKKCHLCRKFGKKGEDICVCCDACFKVEHVKCAKLSAAPAPEASWFCTTCTASKTAGEERAEQARTGGRKPTSSRNGSRNKLSKKEMVKKALHSKEAHIRLYSEATTMEVITVATLGVRLKISVEMARKSLHKLSAEGLIKPTRILLQNEKPPDPTDATEYRYHTAEDVRQQGRYILAT